MKKTIIVLRKYFLFTLIFFAAKGNISAQTQMQVTVTPPSAAVINDGSIVFKNLTASHNFTLSYTYTPFGGTHVAVAAAVVQSDAQGTYTIKNLSAGSFTDFIWIDGTTTYRLNPIILEQTPPSQNIAVQTTKFFGAAYANFTGVQDDNPSGYSQFYARLSQPLHQSQGISMAPAFHERFIFLRNFVFQLTYSNTDNFKVFTVDTNANKYVNRMDLFAHAYFNGNLTINLLTFVMPKDWKNKTGDMAHIYLDLIAALLVTNVTDSGSAFNAATAKTYNVKSNLFGLNLKASFTNAFDTKFNVEIGMKALLVCPSTSSVNYKLDPMNEDGAIIGSPQNAMKTIVNSKNYFYPEIDALVQYNTGGNSTPATSNQNNASTSNSNVFIRYSYATNFAGNSSRHFANNYFQFQIGYALDISKMFYTQPVTATPTGH